jgi:hypothetical protein
MKHTLMPFYAENLVKGLFIFLINKKSKITANSVQGVYLRHSYFTISVCRHVQDILYVHGEVASYSTHYLPGYFISYYYFVSGV